VGSVRDLLGSLVPFAAFVDEALAVDLERVAMGFIENRQIPILFGRGQCLDDLLAFEEVARSDHEVVQIPWVLGRVRIQGR
jgi:hypothetical protein